jgi:phage virion morphogenesis protein
MTATAVLTIDGAGLRELARELDQVDGDRGEALEAIGAAWESDIKSNFAKGTAPDGTPWKVSERARRRGGKGTLVLSGDLRDSVTHDVIGDDTVEVGTNKIYAAAHQFGVTIQRAGAHAVPLVLPDSGYSGAGGVVQLPARPFIGWNAGLDEAAAEILEGFIAARTGGPA